MIFLLSLAHDPGSPGIRARAGQLTELTIDRIPVDNPGSSGYSSDNATTPKSSSGNDTTAGAIGGGGTSSSLAVLPQPVASLAGTMTGGGGGGPLGSTRVVSIATSRLRPVEDPMSGMLSQLHKIMWVEQLPPGLARDPRRRCVEAFRRLLFAPGTGPVSLKSHLVKLMGAEGDLIRDVSGRPVDFGAVPLGGEGGIEGTSGCGLSYDQLHQVRSQDCIGIR